jgi:hypothetical protein
MPEQIRSDNEPVFRSLSNSSKYGQKWNLISVYSPFSNGICERIMAEVGSFIQTVSDWPTDLRMLQKNLNSKTLPEGYSPFQIVFGRDFEGTNRLFAEVPEEADTKALIQNRKQEIEQIAIDVRQIR